MTTSMRGRSFTRRFRRAGAFVLGLALLLAPSAGAGAGTPAVGFFTDSGVEVVDLDGAPVTSLRDFQSFSLNGNVLAGSFHLAGNRSEKVVVHDATTGERLFRIADATAPVVVDGGRKIFFWPDRMANRDKYGTSIWMRNAAGKDRRVFQFTGPRATVPRDPFQGDGSPLGIALDESGRTMAVPIGNDVSLFKYDVWVVNTKTRAATRVTKGMVSRFPSVSPEGTQIAVAREVAQCGGPEPGYRASKLQVMSSTGAGKRTLVDGDCDLFYTDPRWVSETELVAARLTKESAGEYLVDLVKIDASTGAVTDLVADGTVSYLTVSPSLQQVAFHRRTDDQGFWLYDLATDEITHFPTGYIPHLSGEGRLI